MKIFDDEIETFTKNSNEKQNIELNDLKEIKQKVKFYYLFQFLFNKNKNSTRQAEIENSNSAKISENAKQATRPGLKRCQSCGSILVGYFN